MTKPPTYTKEEQDEWARRFIQRRKRSSLKVSCARFAAQERLKVGPDSLRSWVLAYAGVESIGEIR